MVDQMQTVVSVHLAPRIDDKGLIHADLEKVTGGQLPLPQTFWNRFASKLAIRIAAQIPLSQQRATLYPDGSANDQMGAMVLAKMMVKFLHGESADPVVFLQSGVFHFNAEGYNPLGENLRRQAAGLEDLR